MSHSDFAALHTAVNLTCLLADKRRKQVEHFFLPHYCSHQTIAVAKGMEGEIALPVYYYTNYGYFLLVNTVFNGGRLVLIDCLEYWGRFTKGK